MLKPLPKLAFTDRRPVAIGATGEVHPRAAMSLVNIAYASVLTWSNPEPQTLEEPMLVPLFGEHPLELGLPADGKFVLASDPKYRELFSPAVPDDPDLFTVPHITKALACFERTIISAHSPWDQHNYAPTRLSTIPASANPGRP